MALLSHELGGPVAVLRGYATLWLEDSFDAGAASLVELGRGTWEDASQLAAGLQELLAASRLVSEAPDQDVLLAAAIERFQRGARPAVGRLRSKFDRWLERAAVSVPGSAVLSVQTCYAKTLMLLGLLDQLSLAIEVDDRPAEERVVVELGRWVRRLAHQVAGGLMATGHRLVVETGPAPMQVLVTEDLLQAAVLNLLDNAQKHSPAGTPVVLSVAGAGDSVALTVSDRGPGLPDGHLPQLFARVDQPSAFGLPGLGLGLAIATRAARVDGGELRYSRRPEGGSTFTIVLPRYSA